MSRRRLARVRRALFIAAAGAFVWSVMVALTGGFYYRIGGLQLSSRDYHDALLIGLMLGLTAIALTGRVGGWQTLRHEWVSLTGPVVAHAGRMATYAKAWWQVATIAAGVRRHAAWLTVAPAAAIAIAGIALDISQWLDARPLWLDEEMILLNVRDRASSDLGGLLWLGQSAPFGWLVVERAALVTLGTGELALRLVPVLFGIATIVVAFWIGRRWMSPLGGAALVLLCTFGHVISHYPLEAKHYSADTFWAMLLPALAVWATEGEHVATRGRRLLVWWVVAATGQALANGALLVAPGCALLLLASVYRRDGYRAAMVFALSGVVWLAAFGLHYQFSLGAVHESAYLHNYWATEMPAASIGLVDRVRWIGDRLEALAINPAGTEWWMALWLSAALGLALGRSRALGLIFATAPLSAFVLSGFRIVPLYERFVLWMVPALYVGLAMAIDRASHVIRDAYQRRRWAPAVLAAPLLFVAGAVSLNIYTRGKTDIDHGRPADNKHQLDDRAAVRWLMTRLQPGDAVMTTRLAWPAVWWYGDISISNTDPDGVVRHPGGVPLLEVEHARPGSHCRGDQLREDLSAYRRVLVYLGFRDVPQGFDYLLLHTLDQLGTIEAFSEWSELGRAAVIDLHDPAPSALTLHIVSPKTVENAVPLNGCARVRAARRWLLP